MEKLVVLSLFSTLMVELHPEQKKRLAVIDMEDYSGVVRKTTEYFSEINFAVPEGYMERGIYALKQYYAVAMLDPANAHAVSRPVDPFWHAHILHTEQYVEFCNRVVGEYMHHRPLNHGNKEHVAVIRRLYGYTLDVLPQFFSVVDNNFWTKDVPDEMLICMHKGNQEIYRELQPMRFFEPNERGVGSLA